MVPRRHEALGIILSTLLSFVCGCSRDIPTSTSGVGLHPPGSPTPGTVDIILVPDASGTVRRLPEMDILDVAPVSTDMQSAYFRTTVTNREFRRGFAEFAVPDFTDGFASARIDLRETRASISLEVPPDRHELSSYSRADLVVDPSDFDRPTSPVATFETDANLETGAFAFDVTRQVARSEGSSLGFRMKLSADPTEANTRFLGTTFGRFTTPPSVTIVVKGVSPRDAGDHLQYLIRGLHLSPDMEGSLIDPLRQAVALLRDDTPENDMEACGKIRTFLDVVAIRESDGGVSDLQAADLRQAALRLAAGLGCPD